MMFLALLIQLASAATWTYETDLTLCTDTKHDSTEQCALIADATTETNSDTQDFSSTCDWSGLTVELVSGDFFACVKGDPDDYGTIPSVVECDDNYLSHDLEFKVNITPETCTSGFDLGAITIGNSDPDIDATWSFDKPSVTSYSAVRTAYVDVTENVANQTPKVCTPVGTETGTVKMAIHSDNDDYRYVTFLAENATVGDWDCPAKNSSGGDLNLQLTLN